MPIVLCITNLADPIDFIDWSWKIPYAKLYQQIFTLASTDNQVDEWNHQIQELNSDISNAKELLSADILCEVDDPHDILAEIL